MEGESGIGYYTHHLADDSATGYNFFQKEKLENAFIRSEIVELKPINSISAGPIWFQIGQSDSKHIIPLNRIRCDIKLQFTKSDGSNLSDTENEKIGFVNYLGNNLFENINVKLNGVAISDHSRHHNLRSTIQMYFSYNSEATKITHSINRYTNTSRNSTAFADDCPSFAAKKSESINSAFMHLNFIPLLDIASSNNFLCNTHELFLEFERGKDNWCFITEAALDIKINIVDFKLQVQYLFPTPTFEATLNRQIATHKFFYNFTRNVMRTHQLYTGATNCSWNNIFLGQLPRSVYFIFLDKNQISSSQPHDPQIWLSYKISSASVNINGYRHPANSLKYDIANKDTYNGYRWFLDNIGLQTSNDDVGITLDQYYTSRFMIPFDLSPRADNGCIMHKATTGSLNFTCTFAEATTIPLTVVCYAVFDNTVAVDPKRNVILDYQI